MVVAGTGAVGASVGAGVHDRPRILAFGNPVKLTHVAALPSLGGGHFAHHEPDGIYSRQSSVGGAVYVMIERYECAIRNVVANVDGEGGGALRVGIDGANVECAVGDGGLRIIGGKFRNHILCRGMAHIFVGVGGGFSCALAQIADGEVDGSNVAIGNGIADIKGKRGRQGAFVTTIHGANRLSGIRQRDLVGGGGSVDDRVGGCIRETVLDGDIQREVGVGHSFCIVGDRHIGDADAGTFASDDIEGGEGGLVVLCGSGQLIGLTSVECREGERAVAVGIRQHSRDQVEVVGQCHVAVGCASGDCDGGGAVNHLDGVGNRSHIVHADGHVSRLAEPRHDGRVAHQLVNLPVVFYVGVVSTIFGLNRHIAGIIDRTLCYIPVAEGFAVGVTHLVVCTEVVGIVGGQVAVGATGAQVTATNTYCPIVVVVPIGVVGTTDVAHGALVGGAEKGLTEALALFKLVRLTAVTDHKAVLSCVGHRGDVTGGEGGI